MNYKNTQFNGDLPLRILVADDRKEIRLVLSTHLKKWGYTFIEADNGKTAWEILNKDHIDILITDWMMPEINGIELCKKIRESLFSHYIYIIMLTARGEKNDLIEGMEAGADDFMVKPFAKDEIKVRIKAAERILLLERELAGKNKKLEKAYGVITEDLKAAAQMQKSLLPPNCRTLSGIKFDWLFCPSGFLAGDIFNFFTLDENHTAFYLLDVAGHGIPSAMLSVSLSHELSLPGRGDLLRKYIPETGYYEIHSPAEVVAELNRRYESNNDSIHYFTMIYGVIDNKKGKLTLTQAGHPSPLYIPFEGEPSFIGTGGFPVGMFSLIDYEEHEIRLKKGDRLFIYSDGISDCRNKDNEVFSDKMLYEFFLKYGRLSIDNLMKILEETLNRWKKDEEFEDDISLLSMEFME